MVLKSPFEGGPSRFDEKPPRPKHPSRHPLASPMDRMLSFAIDTLIQLPLVSFFLSPFRKWILEARLLDQETRLIYLVAFSLLAAIVVGVFYQVLFLRVLSATPGKMFFGLKVESISGEKRLSWSACWLRTVIWYLQAVLLFVPFLSLLSNFQRRPAHDRVADTIVVGKRRRAVGPPTMVEQSFVQGVFMAFIFLIGFWTLVIGYQGYLAYKQSGDTLLSMDFKGVSCPEVESARENWDSDPLSISMALFAAGEMQKECVEIEADLALWQDSENPQAYLAMALISEGNEKVRSAYLKKVCDTDKDSEDCKASQLLPLWTQNKVNEITLMLDDIDLSNNEFIGVWAVQHYHSVGKPNEVLKVLNHSPRRKKLSDFFSSYRVKSLWESFRYEEAREAMEVSLYKMQRERQMELSGWFCQREMRQGCGQAMQSSSCRFFARLTKKYPELLSIQELALTHLNQQECSIDNISYAGLQRQVHDPDLKILIKAVQWIRSNRPYKARRALWSLVDRSDVHLGVRMEARFRLVAMAKKRQDLDLLLHHWKREKQTSVKWKELGRLLLAKFDQLGAKKEYQTVALKLLEYHSLEDKWQRRLVVHLYRNGDFNKAWLALKELVGVSRKPAADDEFSKVSKELKARFAGQ